MLARALAWSGLCKQTVRARSLRRKLECLPSGARRSSRVFSEQRNLASTSHCHLYLTEEKATCSQVLTSWIVMDPTCGGLDRGKNERGRPSRPRWEFVPSLMWRLFHRGTGLLGCYHQIKWKTLPRKILAKPSKLHAVIEKNGFFCCIHYTMRLHYDQP